MFLEAKDCSNGVFGVCSEYGKSPCFSRDRLVHSVGLDTLGSVLRVFDVGGTW